ncbi:biotin/lipoyl-binding protein [Tuanshanicoccus lijuaniae]|uniref:biotin/lipoyl-containing protein n=1 Tax=Aerococcaceae bacterium zg-1292 TaxID=2774330 RepID=UPI0019386406|nr:biotin/lipoyl-binding protein [Aerococcaceae bacterium zg-1292]MBF6626418.1 biotin/lipoyl-binding protein [Aerococcaceae bacterium zg-BR9]MBS4455709.1 biotin/lipoyl-binding protein [Aerococcaceae bacterium zg-A91]MBS4457460.1 biotin/lipoyl-binding protein [Aerococcaceae bacterium zg-BR33]QQA37095.1 biotin/lipoyl-binding protein [Aerococcaceae bacterium zg-1292]
MKKYNVKINGNVYEVEIEEAGGTSSAAKTLSVPKPSIPSSIPTTSRPSTSKVEAPTASVASDGEIISAPMPGTVIDVLVSVGDLVKAGQPLLVLEAMKMENEIVAPRDTKVSTINTSKGAAVNTGDALITLD